MSDTLEDSTGTTAPPDIVTSGGDVGRMVQPRLPQQMAKGGTPLINPGNWSPMGLKVMGVLANREPGSAGQKARAMKAGISGKTSGLFDLSRDAMANYGNELPEQWQPERPQRKKAGRSEDWAGPILADPDVQNTMLGHLDRGIDRGYQHWYNMQPLRQHFMREFGMEKGHKAFNRYIDMLAATSTKSPTGVNHRIASYYYGLQRAGALPRAAPLDEGFGSVAQGHHLGQADRFDAGDFPHLTARKTGSFGENLRGNMMPTTVDSHAFKAPLMAAIQHRPDLVRPGMFKTEQYSGNDGKDPVTGKTIKRFDLRFPYPRAMLERGEVDPRDLPPSTLLGAPEKFDYEPFEKYFGKLGGLRGLQPAQAQAAIWGGAGEHTGLVSSPDPMLHVFDRSLLSTAHLVGEHPRKVLKEFMRGRMPMLESSKINADPDDFAEGGRVGLPPLPGLPSSSRGPSDLLRRVSTDYTRKAGLRYAPPAVYAKLDPMRARMAARDFGSMEHDPQHPLVKAAYGALANETGAQYEALRSAGLKPRFGGYGNAPPQAAINDLLDNKQMAVYPTADGFGSDDQYRDNPLMGLTGEKWDGEPVYHNDMFRFVHDAMGHGTEGVGFRAPGEDNAYRGHMATFSPLAQIALAGETRGQNSWLNAGPFAQSNKGAATVDEDPISPEERAARVAAGQHGAPRRGTMFADQKAGILPLRSILSGTEDFIRPENAAALRAIYQQHGLPTDVVQPGLKIFQKAKNQARRRGYAGGGPIKVHHGTGWEFDKFDPKKIGKGEGAQVYGHGLYVTEDPNVARWYAKNLARDTPGFSTFDGQKVSPLLRRALADPNGPYGGALSSYTPAQLLGHSRQPGGLRGLVQNRLDWARGDVDAAIKRRDAYRDKPPLASTYTDADYDLFAKEHGRRVDKLAALRDRFDYTPGKKISRVLDIDLHADPDTMLHMDRDRMDAVPENARGITEDHPDLFHQEDYVAPGGGALTAAIRKHALDYMQQNNLGSLVASPHSPALGRMLRMIRSAEGSVPLAARTLRTNNAYLDANEATRAHHAALIDHIAQGLGGGQLEKGTVPVSGTGHGLRDDLTARIGDPAKTANYFRAHGIPALKYATGNTRDWDDYSQKKHNYVVLPGEEDRLQVTGVNHLADGGRPEGGSVQGGNPDVAGVGVDPDASASLAQMSPYLWRKLRAPLATLAPSAQQFGPAGGGPNARRGTLMSRAGNFSGDTYFTGLAKGGAVSPMRAAAMEHMGRDPSEMLASMGEGPGTQAALGDFLSRSTPEARRALEHLSVRNVADPSGAYAVKPGLAVGEKTAVSYRPDQTAMLLNPPEQLVTVHNHPHGSSLVPSFTVPQPHNPPEVDQDIGTWMAAKAHASHAKPADGRRLDLITDPSGSYLSALVRHPHGGAMGALSSAAKQLSGASGANFMRSALSDATGDHWGYDLHSEADTKLLRRIKGTLIRAKMLEDHGINTFASNHGSVPVLDPYRMRDYKTAAAASPRLSARMTDDTVRQADALRDAFRKRTGFSRGGATNRRGGLAAGRSASC